MICRKVCFEDGVSHWLIISQVEHARLSGCLAELCLDQFGASETKAFTEVRQELLRAIIHHDDGWQAWEANPPLDKNRHRPLAFDEVPAADAFEIWTNSALAVCQFGDLAPWVVASHFSAILATSEHHLRDPAAKAWLAAISERRSEWFARWHARNERVHTLQLAGEALKWLQLFDILSLWPCMLYPVAGEDVGTVPEDFTTAKDWILVREIRPTSEACQQIAFDPWPFRQHSVTMEASAQLAPVGSNKTSAELLAACQPFTARWELVPG